MSTTNGFNGTRLKKARLYRGWTVAELAEKLGCSRQMASTYENKNTAPMDIENLSKITGFPTAFFFQEDKPLNVGSTYFRALLTTNKKYRTEQIQKMEFVSQIYSFLREYISSWPDGSPIIPVGTEPETAAKLLRQQWGLGDRPIENIIRIVENKGILVTSFDTTTDDVDAFSQFVHITQEDGKNESRFIIGYSNNKTSAARIHFDIAHELGHICLHDWDEDIEELEKDEFRNREDEANKFAAAFLLPQSSFGQEAKNTPLTVPAYTQLKRKWKVSIAAMAMRSRNLGLISMDEYRNFIITMQKRKLRKEEPLDDILLTASPAILKTAINMLFTEEIFTPQTFMEELAYSHNLSLTSKEMDRLLDMKGVFYSSTIIPFPELKIK